MNNAAVNPTMVQPGSIAVASAMGKNAAMNAPMKGTNRISPARMPHRTAFGTPISHRPMADDDAEARIEQRLHQKEAAEARRRVIECGGGALKVCGAGQAQKAVADVLTLQQDEQQEQYHQRSRRQRRQQRPHEVCDRLQPSRLRLPHLHRQRLLTRRRRILLGDLFLQVPQRAGCTIENPRRQRGAAQCANLGAKIGLVLG